MTFSTFSNAQGLQSYGGISATDIAPYSQMRLVKKTTIENGVSSALIDGLFPDRSARYYAEIWYGGSITQYLRMQAVSNGNVVSAATTHYYNVYDQNISTMTGSLAGSNYWNLSTQDNAPAGVPVFIRLWIGSVDGSPDGHTGDYVCPIAYQREHTPSSGYYASGIGSLSLRKANANITHMTGLNLFPTKGTFNNASLPGDRMNITCWQYYD